MKKSKRLQTGGARGALYRTLLEFRALEGFSISGLRVWCLGFCGFGCGVLGLYRKRNCIGIGVDLHHAGSLKNSEGRHARGKTANSSSTESYHTTTNKLDLEHEIVTPAGSCKLKQSTAQVTKRNCDTADAGPKRFGQCECLLSVVGKIACTCVRFARLHLWLPSASPSSAAVQHIPHLSPDAMEIQHQ